MAGSEIFCDGVVNGKSGRAGFGVVYNTGESPRNVCEKLGASEPQTVERAALKALLRALQRVGTFEDATIYCSVQYVIDGVHTKLKKWQKQKWGAIDGKPLADADENIDLWQHVGMYYRPTIHVKSVFADTRRSSDPRWERTILIAHEAAQS